MSLELVLAGLFPPGPTQMWNEMLPWQPIPYNYVPFKGDSMMRYPLFCPKFRTLFDKVQSSGHFQKFWDSNIELIDYISKNSGVNISNYFDLSRIFDILYTETKTFRKIPKWTRKVFPEFLTEVTNLYYEISTYTDEINKLSGGSLLKKIIDDMEAKRSKTLSPKGRKIFLYSGHEFNVAFILGALKVFKPRTPPYGSYVVIELHKVGDIFGVKVFYQDYSQVKPKYLIIPGCDVFCPFNQFITLTKSVIPNNDDFLCFK